MNKQYLKSQLEDLKLNILNSDFSYIDQELTKCKNKKINFQPLNTSLVYKIYKNRFIYWGILGLFFFSFILVLLTKIASDISPSSFFLDFILDCIWICLCMFLGSSILTLCSLIYRTSKVSVKSNTVKADSSRKYQYYLLGRKIGKNTSKISCRLYKQDLENQINIIQEFKEKFKYLLPVLLICNIFMFYFVTGIKIDIISKDISPFIGGISLVTLIVYLIQFIVQFLDPQDLFIKKEFVFILDIAIEMERNKNF
jgi:hypothetical protein